MNEPSNASPASVADSVREELSDWRRWAARAVVLGFAVLAGLSVVLLTRLSEWALAAFFHMTAGEPAWALLWTPTITAAVVWLTRRWAPGAAGSGIPQVLAALDHEVPPGQRGLFVSLRLSVAKLLLTTGSLLAGLSTGREGPSVQVAAGVMHHARRWLPKGSQISERGLMVAGGAAGVAAAFNTPLGGVMFAIEQLSRRAEDRSSGLLIAAIVLSGLIAVSIYGDKAYFGQIQTSAEGAALWWPGLCIALATGLAGGLFSRLVVQSLVGGRDRLSQWRQQRPIAFAAACGLLVAIIGVVSGGATFGSGYATTHTLLSGQDETHVLYAPLRFLATWLSAWSGAPGGVFAPSLAIGAGIGSDIAQWTGHMREPAFIALGMVGFLAAATQAPITAFIIVMEMVEGHALVLSLMACAMVASAVSRLISAPMYAALAQAQRQRCPQEPNDCNADTPPETAPSRPCHPDETRPQTVAGHRPLSP